jgi:hypothetical protein
MAPMKLTARRAEKGVPEALARFGFFARGLVYVLMGAVAAPGGTPPARARHGAR